MTPVESLMSAMPRLDDGHVEIYSFDVCPEDWIRTIAWLRDSNAIASFRRSGVDVTPEVGIDDFVVSDDEEHREIELTVELGGSEWRALFFDADEISFVGRPSEISSREAAQAVLSFMDQLAILVGRPVILVPETAMPRSVRPIHTAEP